MPKQPKSIRNEEHANGTTVEIEGMHPTRVSRSTTVIYEGRLRRDRLLSCEALKPVRGKEVHYIREYVKGMLAKCPALIKTSASHISVEVLYQRDGVHRIIAACNNKITPKEARDVFEYIARELPVAAARSAHTMMRNHDEDLREKHPDEVNDWRARIKTAEHVRALAAETLNHTHWNGKAQAAKHLTRRANELKKNNKLAKAPRLDVFEADAAGVAVKPYNGRDPFKDEE